MMDGKFTTIEDRHEDHINGPPEEKTKHETAYYIHINTFK